MSKQFYVSTSEELSWKQKVVNKLNLSVGLVCIVNVDKEWDEEGR